MPTPTYIPIASVTLASSANPVVFSNISQSYRDLILVFDGNIDASGSLMFRLNLDSNSNYSYVIAQGNGSSATSNATSTNLIFFGNSPNSTTNRSNQIAQIMDYSATDKHKSILARTNDATQLVQMIAGRWANTAGVTTIQVYGSGANMRAGSNISLYGIAS